MHWDAPPGKPEQFEMWSPQMVFYALQMSFKIPTSQLHHFSPCIKGVHQLSIKP
jgi:hypothetical protein